jgi:phosphoserine aminotransferase
MISFYPGPSRVHDEIPQYVRDAYEKGMLSVNHRSDDFMRMSEKTIGLLKEKLNIPQDYKIFYTSSATECWEIIAQSIVAKESFHLFNGAFGEKWFEYTKRICPGAKRYPFDREKLLNVEEIFPGNEGVICITQNETANGTQVGNELIRSIKKNNPKHLLAIDATSSMAGIELDFSAGDIWFASVQKCFGLPAGLGLLVCSPSAIEHVKKIGENNHYNSLTFMNEMIMKWQTPFTPNVLNIYLLMRVMEDSEPIGAVNKKIKSRYKDWIEFLDNSKTLEHLVKNESIHSYTVIAVAAPAERVATIKQEAKKNGLLLGEGYGELKNTTFRIANFPAIHDHEIERLEVFLKSIA